MATSDALFLSSGPSKLVKTSPIVLFSILDNFIRRNEGQERVIGTLLGTVTDDVVEVTNCFAVPHFEKDGEVAVGKDLHQQMFSLYSKINQKEQIVGWYSTPFEGAAITDACCLIQEFYAEECNDPVHIVLDTTMAGDKLGARAFVTVPLEAAELSLAVQFEEIALETKAEEDTSIAVHRMTTGQSGGWDVTNPSSRSGPTLTSPHALSAPLHAAPGAGTLALDAIREAAVAKFLSEGGSEEDAKVAGEAAVAEAVATGRGGERGALEASLQELLQMLERVTKYVDEVREGKRAASHAVGREIGAALAAVPRLSKDTISSVLETGVQDLLLVGYLSNLTRAQLAVADRLNLAGI